LVEFFLIFCYDLNKSTQKTLHSFCPQHELLDLNLGLVELLVSKLAFYEEVGLQCSQIKDGSSLVVLLNETKLFLQILLRVQENVKFVAVENVWAQ
jgi:hypothetical protein